MNDLRPLLVTPWLATPVVHFRRTQVPPVNHQLGADEQGWGGWLAEQWYATAAGVHRLVWGGAASLTTGITVPAEVADPTLARNYLADVLVRLGTVHGWPPEEVARRAAAMRAERNAGTVHDTIDRVVAYGPPATWSGAQSWYSIAQEMQRTASVLASGEAAGVVRSTTIAVATNAQRTAQNVIDGARDSAGNLGLGLGLGLGVLAVGALIVAGGPAPLFNAARQRASARG